jgi:hypothetical protein
VDRQRKLVSCWDSRGGTRTPDPVINRTLTPSAGTHPPRDDGAGCGGMARGRVESVVHWMVQREPGWGLRAEMHVGGAMQRIAL